MTAPSARPTQPRSATVLRSIGESGPPAGAATLVDPPIPPSHLRQHGAAVLRRLMTPAAAASLAAELFERQRRNDLTLETDLPGAWAAYAEPIFQVLLVRTQAIVESVTGARLDPTYSYARVYTRGSDLPPHIDREACEVSISIALGADGDHVWPFWAEFDGRVYAIDLAAGDAVLYLGHECRHWREPLAAAWSAHVFLHYVFRDGDFAAYRFDDRP